VLMLTALLGMMVLASARELVLLFVAFELMSIPLYYLTGFLKREAEAVEAALKFFLVGTVSSAVLVYGLSFVYGIAGTTDLGGIASALRTGHPLIMLGMVLALTIGVVPRARALLSPLLGTIAMIPPLAILPVLFIVLGLEETAKIALIVIGIAPCIARDLALRVGELPKEQIIKAQTLGASTWQLVVRVVLPQLWPRLIDSLRLSMGSAWLFLIAAEAIASTEGLGYRIFLVRRYLAMDVILPYVVWITLLAVLTDLGLRVLRTRAFRWAEPER